MRRFISEMTDKVLAGGELSVDEGARLIEGTTRDTLMDLLAGADRIRRQYVGNEVHLCSIVNAKSGRCSEDCGFCAQSSRFETGVDEYELLDAEQVKKAAKEAKQNGAEALGLVAAWRGLKQGPELDKVCNLIEEVAAEGDVHPDASLGLISDPEVARRLKQAGLHTYNHNLETARSHFETVVDTHSFDDRLSTLRHVRDAGMNLCSGGILGMGETARQRVELAAELRELDPDLVPLNFLNPIDGTPMATEHGKLSPLEALVGIAVFRFMLPKHHIMVAGGREVVLGDLAPLMYLAGASATMVGNYLTTGGATPEDDLAVIAGFELEPRVATAAATGKPLPLTPRPASQPVGPAAGHAANAAVASAAAAKAADDGASNASQAASDSAGAADSDAPALAGEV
ncbi:MAG: biotin synthase [Planctomycetota bacterium]|nr:MAG: biotin synthase [Planctomycetota bacterium]